MSSTFYDIELEVPGVPMKPLQQSLGHSLPEPIPVKNASADDPDSVATDPAQPWFTTSKEGMAAKLSRRVARRPCTYLMVCLLISTGLSVMAMIVGEFSVSANTGGWQSRGTMIADRQTQLMIAQSFQQELFYGDDAVWEKLMNNVLPGWEDDDDDSEGRRSLTFAVDGMYPINSFEPSFAGTLVDYLHPTSDRIQLHRASRELPFFLSPELHRQLQISLDDKGCDMTWYSETNLTQDVHLWPVWKTKSSSHSVFEPAVLRDVCEAEAKTQTYLEANDLCMGCKTGCLPAYSIVMFARLMVDDGWSMSCSDLADAWMPIEAQLQTELVACVADLKTTNDAASDSTLPLTCPPYFSATMVADDIDIRNGKSQYSSSIFATRMADIDELYDAVDHFYTAESSSLVDGAYDTQYEDFVGLYLDESLSNDMALALGSAVVVAAAIIIHTRSPFITLIGLVQIILSFPLSYMVYKLIAGLDFFPFLNFIGIFVVFALGAGDIFVAIDKWRDARQADPLARTEDIAAKAFPDAALAMFLTSFTTAIAFFSTATCPVAPIKMFSIFCGLLVSFDYIMNVLLVFPALCIYDRALQAKGYQGVSCCMSCSCFGMLRHREPAAVATQKMNDNTMSDGEDDMEMTAKAHEISDSVTNSSLRNTSRSLGEYSDDPNLGLVRRALHVFYKFLHMSRWLLFVGCAAALGVSIYYASKLSLPKSSDVRLLDDQSQFERNYLWRQHLLSTVLEKSSGSEAYMIWGVKPADTGDINNPGTWSEFVLDSSFDSSSNESQVFLRNFCEEMFAQDFASPVDSNYTCPLTRFERWLAEQSEAVTPQENYTQNCNNASSLPVDPTHWDSCLIGWSKLEVEPNILSRNGKVTIVMVPFASRVRYDDDYDQLDDEWKLIENWVNIQNSNAPEGVDKGYFSSFDFWWYDTNGQMLSTAFSSAALALGGAAVVILFTSQSIVLTLFCTFTIGYVLTSVTATLVAMGWTLGFLESICFAILIGVSVDFVIHFGHAYSMAAKGDADRGFRTRYALISMGPSILATALTTILSAVVMLFTVITFFQKFALILFLTIVQACIGSFFVFLTMTDCIGPRNPTYLVDRLQRYWTRS